MKRQSLTRSKDQCLVLKVLELYYLKIQIEIEADIGSDLKYPLFP